VNSTKYNQYGQINTQQSTELLL